MCLGPPGRACMVFQSYLWTQADSAHQTLCGFKPRHVTIQRAIKHPFCPRLTESEAAQVHRTARTCCSGVHECIWNVLAIESSFHEGIESSLPMIIRVMKPQFRMKPVGWNRYLTVCKIYRPIHNIRSIYIHIQTLYKHIRM